MSSNGPLSPFSYVVLALVGEGGAGAHDLKRMMERGRIYWTAAPSQYYAEAKRLAERGLLAGRREAGRTRERTHYTLTAAGREALKDWARRPVPFARIQNEPVVRLLAADIVGPEAVLEGLRALRAEIDEVRAGVAEGEDVSATLPGRRRALMLNHRLARRLLDAHVEWLEEVERELAPDQ